MGINMNVEKINYRTIIKNQGMATLRESIIKASLNNDMLVFCKCNGVPNDVIEAASRNCIAVFYMMDAVTHLQNPEFYGKAKVCDFSVVTRPAMKQALEDHGITKPIYHIVQGIDPREFHPVEAEKKHDVVFIGTRGEKRDRLHSIIMNQNHSVKTYGHGYGEIVKGEDFNRACCSAKICLAIPGTDAEIDGLSDRTIRYMATKSCVLTEYWEGIENYFKNDEHLVWFKSEDELVRIVNDLLADNERRTRIAQAGYDKVIADHTWSGVVEQLINIAKLNLKTGEA